MIKLKHILTEKKDLHKVHIDKIAVMTDRNNHTKARMFLAQMIGDKKLVSMYGQIFELSLYLRDMGKLHDVRNRLDKELFRQAQRKFSNFKDINKAF